MYRLALCLLLTGVALAAEDPKSDPIETGKVDDGEWKMVNESYVMTDEIFETVLVKESHVLIYAYVEWCGVCQSFAPIWKQVAEKINKGTEFKTKAFSALIESNKKIHDGWHVTGFPSIFYVREGTHKMYSTMRTEEALLQWVRQNEESPVLDVTEEELEESVGVSDISVVGTFSSEELAKKFENASWTMELPAAFRLNAENPVDGITVYSNYEGKPHKVTLKDFEDWDWVRRFISRSRRPFVIPFNRDNHKMVFEIEEITASVLLFHDKDEGYEARLQAFGMAARTYGQGFNFVNMEMSESYVNNFVDFFKVKSADVPIAYILDTAEDSPHKGQMSKTKDVSEKGIAQLIEDYEEGTTEMFSAQTGGGRGGPDPEEESAELPDDWNNRPIKFLTSKNYEEYVLDNNQEVFVMIYRDSCPHCQDIKPTWDELAVKYEKHPSLKIAHMKSAHISALRELGLEVEYVPTLLLYTKSAKSLADAIPHGEDKTIEGLDKFLFENAFNAPELGDVEEEEIVGEEEEDEDGEEEEEIVGEEDEDVEEDDYDDSVKKSEL